MAPIGLKFVVAFSSQDSKYTAENILSAETHKPTTRWLSAPDDRSGRLEATVQLEKPSRIDYVDIGNCGAATIELSVGQSSWPQGKPYNSLLPAQTFMNIKESRYGENKNGIRMFTSEHFMKSNATQLWDRLKIICCQPYKKDKPFGLSFIRLRAKDPPKAFSTSSAALGRNQLDSHTNKTKAPSQGRFASPSWKANAEVNKLERTETQEQWMARVKKQTVVQEEEDHLSRAAMLIAKATGNCPKSLIIPSEEEKEKNTAFQNDVDEFFNELDSKSIDIDTVTMADLRHRFEKKKYRKLTKEEKKSFFTIGQAYIQDLYDKQQQADDQSEHSSVTCKSSTPKNSKNPTQRSSVASPVNSKPSTPTPGTSSSKYTFTKKTQQSSCQAQQANKVKSNSPKQKTDFKNNPNQGPCNEQKSATPDMFRITKQPCQPPSVSNKQISKAGLKALSRANGSSATGANSESSPIDLKTFVKDMKNDHFCISNISGSPKSLSQNSTPKRHATKTHASATPSPGAKMYAWTGNQSIPVQSPMNGNKKSSNQWLSKKSESPIIVDKPKAQFSAPQTTAVRNKLEVGSSEKSPGMTSPSSPSIIGSNKGRKRNRNPDTKLPSCKKKASAMKDLMFSQTPAVPKQKVVPVQCPLCMKSFPLTEIEEHAANCSADCVSQDEMSSRSRRRSQADWVACPMCGRVFSADEIEEHADLCVGVRQTAQSVINIT